MGRLIASRDMSESLGTKLRRLAKQAELSGPLSAYGVMSSPPTLSNGSVHDSTLSKYVSRSSSVFRYLGATQSGGYFTTSASGGTYMWGVEFQTDAPKLEIWATPGAGIPNNTAYGRLLVDGKLASASFLSMAKDSGYNLVDFTSAGGRKMRSLRFETGNGSTSFAGLQVAPYDTVLAAPTNDSVRAVFAGDSITAGTGSAYFWSNWVATVAKYLGWNDPWASGAAGTGYVATGTSVALGTRLTADVLNLSPSVVVFAMGVNDYAASPSAVQAAATSVFAATRAALPRCLMVVLGPWRNSGQTLATQQAIAAAIYAALQAADAPGLASGLSCFIDPIAGGWLTGTGTDTAPASNGNQDWFMSGATGIPHPNQAGHDFYGRIVAEQIKAALAAVP